MIEHSLPEDGIARGRVLRTFFLAAPPVTAFTVYGVLIDHLPESWFTLDVLRYLLALLASGVVWLGLASLRRLPAVAALLAEPAAPAAGLPVPVEQLPCRGRPRSRCPPGPGGCWSRPAGTCPAGRSCAGGASSSATPCRPAPPARRTVYAWCWRWTCATPHSTAACWSAPCWPCSARAAGGPHAASGASAGPR
ncbi:hypothetical protein ITP53_26100 [Nonomuraea sp. K274]|uniref:Uncharacterized protein n=1 Tax=Nonomuraea cypriaca TaxID=1187855 RepID=A0A931F2K5_9ACTN|nr:hypothetical protein [Nonomuraea cypriaca]MBF8189141.1 hypothetical protein [Nonomuraea cypriaca]